MNKSIFTWLLFIVFLLGCGSTRRISMYNLANQYNDLNFIEIETVPLNINDTTTRIFLKFNRNDLIYEKLEGKEKYYANYSINYRLYPSYEKDDLNDSATYFYTDSLFYGIDTAKINEFDIRTKKGKDYVIQVLLSDLNANLSQDHYMNIERSALLGRDDFIICNSSQIPVFSNSIDKHQQVRIKPGDSTINYLYARYYNRDFPVALPPFVSESKTRFEYKADSTFNVPVEKNTTSDLCFSDEGFYFFQADTSGRAGITIYRFYDRFPIVYSTGHLLEPLRYITTSAEFDKLKNSDNPKVVLDRFWLDNAGNPYRAKEMIKKFYNRVKDANIYFTSYLEGWKTDRGLIYIVFGPPNIVYRANNFEEWIYGEEGHSNSIKFQFVKVINPFTDNDFSLIKSPSYKDKWYNAVGHWRR